MTISRSVLLIMRNVSDKFVQKIKANILCPTYLFFPNIAPFVSNVEKCDRSLEADKWQYGASARHAGKLKLQIDTIYKTYCFSTATMVCIKIRCLSYLIRNYFLRGVICHITFVFMLHDITKRLYCNIFGYSYVLVLQRSERCSFC